MNAVEEMLQEIWSSVLNVPASQISMRGNFFSLGGDSLLSVQVVARVNKKGFKLLVPQIFEYPTIAELE